MKLEWQIVRECRDYLDICRYAHRLAYRIIHIPKPKAGQWQDIEQAKSMAGHADCEIYLDQMRVLHIEFKTEKGKQRAAQKEWQRELEKLGQKYFIVREATELIEILKRFGIEKHYWDMGQIKTEQAKG